MGRLSTRLFHYQRMYRCLRTIRSNSLSNRGGGKDMMEKRRRTNTSIGNTVDIVKEIKMMKIMTSFSMLRTSLTCA
jgi:hypothetical protein